MARKNRTRTRNLSRSEDPAGELTRALGEAVPDNWVWMICADGVGRWCSPEAVDEANARAARRTGRAGLYVRTTDDDDARG